MAASRKGLRWTGLLEKTNRTRGRIDRLARFDERSLRGHRACQTALRSNDSLSACSRKRSRLEAK